MMHRIMNGPFRDAMTMDARDLAANLRIGVREAKAALTELERKGFLVSLTPELPLDKAIVRLTMLPFQGRQPTQDYRKYEPTPDERRRLDKLDHDEAKRRRMGGRK